MRQRKRHYELVQVDVVWFSVWRRDERGFDRVSPWFEDTDDFDAPVAAMRWRAHYRRHRL